jgi:hypothetical protein
VFLRKLVRKKLNAIEGDDVDVDAVKTFSAAKMYSLCKSCQFQVSILQAVERGHVGTIVCYA